MFSLSLRFIKLNLIAAITDSTFTNDIALFSKTTAYGRFQKITKIGKKSSNITRNIAKKVKTAVSSVGTVRTAVAVTAVALTAAPILKRCYDERCARLSKEKENAAVLKATAEQNLEKVNEILKLLFGSDKSLNNDNIITNSSSSTTESESIKEVLSASAGNSLTNIIDEDFFNKFKSATVKMISLNETEKINNTYKEVLALKTLYDKLDIESNVSTVADNHNGTFNYNVASYFFPQLRNIGIFVVHDPINNSSITTTTLIEHLPKVDSLMIGTINYFWPSMIHIVNLIRFMHSRGVSHGELLKESSILFDFNFKSNIESDPYSTSSRKSDIKDRIRVVGFQNSVVLSDKSAGSQSNRIEFEIACAKDLQALGRILLMYLTKDVQYYMAEPSRTFEDLIKLFEENVAGRGNLKDLRKQENYNMIIDTIRNLDKKYDVTKIANSTTVTEISEINRPSIVAQKIYDDFFNDNNLIIQQDDAWSNNHYYNTVTYESDITQELNDLRNVDNNSDWKKLTGGACTTNGGGVYQNTKENVVLKTMKVGEKTKTGELHINLMVLETAKRYGREKLFAKIYKVYEAKQRLSKEYNDRVVKGLESQNFIIPSVSTKSREIQIAFEKIPGNDLFHYILNHKNNGELSRETDQNQNLLNILLTIYQILQGLKIMITSGVKAHTDIKPENIMLNKESDMSMGIKIIDLPKTTFTSIENSDSQHGKCRKSISSSTTRESSRERDSGSSYHSEDNSSIPIMIESEVPEKLNLKDPISIADLLKVIPDATHCQKKNDINNDTDFIYTYPSQPDYTPSYVAPEIFLDADDFDKLKFDSNSIVKSSINHSKFDVYSVGVIFYMLLSGAAYHPYPELMQLDDKAIQEELKSKLLVKDRSSWDDYFDNSNPVIKMLKKKYLRLQKDNSPLDFSWASEQNQYEGFKKLIEYLDSDSSKRLFHLLVKMMHQDPKSRFSVDECIAYLEDNILNEKSFNYRGIWEEKFKEIMGS